MKHLWLHRSSRSTRTAPNRGSFLGPVGRVECVNGTCNIAQATARVRVRGVTYRASVKGQSGSFTTGQSRTVKVVVPKAAYRNLRTKKSGSVTLVLRATAEVPGQSPVERNKNISNGLRR